MTTYGLTSAGLIIKRLADIKTELENAFRDEFGDGTNVQAEGPFGQIIGIFSEREALLWELIEAIYSAIDPASAEGVPLERACALVKVVRLEASFSMVTVTCTGTPSTLIPAGRIFSVLGDTTARFVTDDDATIGIGGTVDVPCTAETAGSVQAPSGSLTVIETPVSGLDSVTNALDADVGRDTETDAELRYRRNLSLQQSLAGTLEAIRAALLLVEDVTKCAGFENNDDVDDGNGRPPHSFEMVAQNGTDADIAETIWESKPAGIQTFGTETETVVDSIGIARTINFSRPTETDIYVEVDITRISGTTIPSETEVQDKILEYGDLMNMGDDVLPVSGILPKIAELSNIKDITLRVGKTVSPTSDDPVEIDPAEIALFDSSRITVNFI